MGDEEEWHDDDDDSIHPLQPSPSLNWSALAADGSARTRQQPDLLRIRFQSRDYSLRQFSETVLDAEAMIQTFAAPFVWSRRPDWDLNVREQLSERITVRTVSMSSPLEIVLAITGAATMTAVALNRWISVRKNWQDTRAAKAEADKAIAESDLMRAEADRDIEKAEVQKLAWSVVKQHLESESQKDFDSLPEKHYLRKMAARSVSALLELETASIESDNGKK